MRVLTIFASLVFAAPLWAATARILPPKGVGVGRAVVASYAELLRLSVVQAGYRVVEGSKTADLTLHPTITKVGSGFVLALERQGGEGEPYADTVRIASEDELDTGTKRLVKAVLAGQPAEQSETVDDVTKTEAESGTARKRTVRHVMFAFGPSWAYGLGSSDLLYDFALGYVWERDHLAPRIFVEANWAPGSSEMGSLHTGLGLDWYILGSRSSPYVGLDAGLGAVSRAHTDANKATNGGRMYYSGFALGAEAGFAIMRTSDVSMYLQGTVRPLLGGIGGKAAGIYGGEIGILF